MDPIAKKARQWIDSGKDPRSAYWQAGLESIMNVFEPYLAPGKLIPIHSLEEKDMAVFHEALAVVDLSPDLLAAFLPPPVADKIRPPETAEEIQRIPPDKPSYKIIVIRPGEDLRILSVEMSAHASKLGADIFQSGALLGTYDFTDREEFLSTLKKILRSHIWKKDKWRPEDHKRYTVNWFERIVELQTKSISVEEDYSFFHTPTLIKSNRIDALCLLIFETFSKRAETPDEGFEKQLSTIRALPDAEQRMAQFENLAEKTALQTLTLIKNCELMDFDSFTDKETQQFSREFERTVRKMANKL